MQNIDSKELKRKLDKNEKFVFLNVLEKEQYNKGHIPASVNIPLKDDEFLEKVAEKAPDKNTEIVTYCAGPDCPASRNAAEKLEEAGYTNVKAFEGGMQEWKNAKYQIAA